MASAGEVTITVKPDYRHMQRYLKVLTLAGEVAQERNRQEDKWGQQHHPDGTGSQYVAIADRARGYTDQAALEGACTWRDILLEEVYKALAEHDDPAALRKELLESAAVIFAWIEDIDGREATEAC